MHFLFNIASSATVWYGGQHC